MISGEINFDRFARGLILIVAFGICVYLINYLSSVLLPFAVAWVLAYLLFPIVNFLQNTCRLRSRAFCVILTLGLVFGTFTVLAWAAVPGITSEWHHLKEIAIDYTEGRRQVTGIAADVQRYFQHNAHHFQIERLLRQDDVVDMIKETLPKLWDMVWSTAGVIMNIVSSLFALIYLFLLLLDYELYSQGWLSFVPERRRRFASQLLHDIEKGMSGYFRGQALVALSNCVLFSLGFWIIGLPLPFLLGVGIGIISFIPYIQLVGFLPAFVLALLKSVDTGESFWMLMGGVVLVYAVIQIIQDVFLTPRIMGHIMGLPAAIVLLSLTAWGYVLGILGLIIALPATTLIIAYYQRYIVKKPTE